MPYFEIRYFHADGTLAVVYVAACASLAEAEEHARLHQRDHVRFEVSEVATGR